MKVTALVSSKSASTGGDITNTIGQCFLLLRQWTDAKTKL